MDTISLITGLAAGFILAFLLVYLWLTSRMVRRSDHDRLSATANEQAAELKLFAHRRETWEAQQLALITRLDQKEAEASSLHVQAATLRHDLVHAENKALTLGNELEEQRSAQRLLQEERQVQHRELAGLSARYQGTTEAVQQYKATVEQQAQQLSAATARIGELTAQESRLSVNQMALKEKLDTQKQEMEQLQHTAHLQFEKIAGQLLEEKSARFAETNKTALETLLNPLKEDIGKFKTKVEETYDKESKQRFSLEEKVRELIEQTNKVSAEANNLATALKGQTKKQGNWGEMILERILETSGLTKGREYFVQQTIRDEEGKQWRPDILVKLPDERVIIIDSKVSLVGYDRFAAADSPEEQQVQLQAHVQSVYRHIDDLQDKQYDNLEQALDFTMMFIPVEPAYLAAIQADAELWAYAYARRILLISPTNLIACLKLISDLWNREKQSRNAMEIVKRGERLYEKFVIFTTSLEEVGRHIGKAQLAYGTAMDQLRSGRGNLVTQALQLKALGLKSSKSIPPALLPVDMEPPEPDNTDQPE
ncbi:DNA recombination protein RmuC [Taibaiella koreensis]|uniref:DNA recombination protein RmuC n=1 Tax=Taibaiella koreensis TaxID=1268548 RepID=UPI000E59AD11|nr:DNA recombination protein RmuC [Taibaiella koreensis]